MTRTSVRGMNWAPTLKGLMLAMALAFLLVGIRQPANIHDEGYVQYGATRIRRLEADRTVNGVSGVRS